MKWTSQSIIELRLQLGWSVAEFSRRFGVPAKTVQSWENNSQSPTADDLRQLDFLSFQSKGYSEALAEQAQAEALINSENYEQIHRSLTFK